MSPWPAPERDIWGSRHGVLSPSELDRALRAHPGWRLRGQRLVGAVDAAAARIQAPPTAMPDVAVPSRPCAVTGTSTRSQPLAAAGPIASGR